MNPSRFTRRRWDYKLAAPDEFIAMALTSRVKNKTPASVQITAEQILREARELHHQEEAKHSIAIAIADADELSDYRLRERKRFEDLVRRDSRNVSAWVRYARWEEEAHPARARSVYERALVEVAGRDHSLWLKYAEFEMRGRRVSHARNVWDRAVTLLPAVDQLWYKYIHMEEMLGAVANARQVFGRWTACTDATAAYDSYVRFELRHGEVERSRAVHERRVTEHPTTDAFIRYAKFEMKRGEAERARQVYERAADLLEEDDDAELLYLAFAEFEEMCGEVERARGIYEYALGRMAKGSSAEDDDAIVGKFMAFRRRFGDREDDAIVGKRKNLSPAAADCKRQRNNS